MASQLSPRQREILDLVAEGRTSKEIAVTLGISESTVNWHIANAFERLGASSRAEAVARAIRSNGTDRPPMPPTVVRPVPVPTPTSWRRLVAIAIAIALAGALIGGATVATLHLGAPVPTASPAKGAERPLLSPATGSTDVVGGETSPAASPPQLGDPTEAPLLNPPTTVPPLPAVSAPPLPSVPVPLPTPALPTLPPTALPLPIPSVPLPVPTPTLPLS